LKNGGNELKKDYRIRVRIRSEEKA